MAENPNQEENQTQNENQRRLQNQRPEMAGRVLVVVLCVAPLPVVFPMLVDFFADLALNVTGYAGSLFEPFRMSGRPQLEGIIRLCLILVVIVIIFKFLLRRPRG